MPDNSIPISQQTLNDFAATIQAKPDLTKEQIFAKFPEFNNDDKILQSAVDYHATAQSGKYKDLSELNSKFPEFNISGEKKNSDSSNTLPLSDGATRYTGQTVNDALAHGTTPEIQGGASGTWDAPSPSIEKIPTPPKATTGEGFPIPQVIANSGTSKDDELERRLQVGLAPKEMPPDKVGEALTYPFTGLLPDAYKGLQEADKNMREGAAQLTTHPLLGILKIGNGLAQTVLTAGMALAPEASIPFMTASKVAPDELNDALMKPVTTALRLTNALTGMAGGQDFSTGYNITKDEEQSASPESQQFRQLLDLGGSMLEIGGLHKGYEGIKNIGSDILAGKKITDEQAKAGADFITANPDVIATTTGIYNKLPADVPTDQKPKLATLIATDQKLQADKTNLADNNAIQEDHDKKIAANNFEIQKVLHPDVTPAIPKEWQADVSMFQKRIDSGQITVESAQRQLRTAGWANAPGNLFTAKPAAETAGTTPNTNDNKNIAGVQSNLGEGQEPVKAEPNEGAGAQAVGGSGMVQGTPEASEQEVKETADKKGIKLTPDEIGDVAAIHLHSQDSAQPLTVEQAIDFHEAEKENKPTGEVAAGSVITHPDSIDSEKGLVNTNDSDNPQLPNDKLSEQGRKDAAEINIGNKQAFVSTNLRTRETYELAQKGDNAPPPVYTDVLKTGDVGLGENGEKTKEADFDAAKWLDTADGKEFKGRMEQAYKLKQDNPDAVFITHSKVEKALAALDKTDGKWTDETTKEFLKEPEPTAGEAAELKPETTTTNEKAKEANKTEVLKENGAEKETAPIPLTPEENSLLKTHIDDGTITQAKAEELKSRGIDTDTKTIEDIERKANSDSQEQRAEAIRQADSIINGTRGGESTEGSTTPPENTSNVSPESAENVNKPLSVDERIAAQKKKIADKKKAGSSGYAASGFAKLIVDDIPDYIHLASLYIEKYGNDFGKFIKGFRAENPELKNVSDKEIKEKLFDEANKKRTTGVSRTELEKTGKELGIETPESGEWMSVEERIQQGKDLIKNGAEPEKVLSDFQKTGKIDDKDISIARAHQADLKKAVYKAIDDFGTDSKEANDARKKLEQWQNDTKKMATTAGASMQALQGAEEIDVDSEEGLRMAVKEKHGKDLTPKQQKEVAEQIAKNKALQEELKALEKKVRDSQNKDIQEEEEKAKQPKNIKAAAKKIADNIRKGKLSRPDVFSSATPASLVWDGAIETAAKTVETGGEIAQAIADGIEHIKASDWYKNNPDKQKEAEKAFANHVKENTKNDDILTRFENKKDNKFSPQDAKDIWNYAKKEYLDKGRSVGDMIVGVSKDLGLNTRQVHEAITSPKTSKIIDEIYRKQAALRRVREASKRWVDNANTPADERIVKATPSFFFQKAVFGHGTVGAVTHGGGNLFNPSHWGTYFRNVARQYKFMNEATYEKAMENMKNDPLYIPLLRAGLDIDPNKRLSEYEEKSVLGKSGDFGNRGFGALKTMRFELAKDYYNSLSEVEKADPESMKMIADMFNAATGSAPKFKLPGALNTVTNVAAFAPKLIASRWNRVVLSPAKAGLVLKRMIMGQEVSPAEKAGARIWAKRTGEQLATLGTMLALNNYILSASGSKQRINFTDPTKRDFLKFKFGNTTVDATGGIIPTVKLLYGILHIPFSTPQQLKGKTKWHALGEQGIDYLGNTLSPLGTFAKDIATSHDYNGNTMPWSHDKPDGHGHKLSWLEYASQQLPIPAAEAVKDIYKAMQERGMSKPQIEDVFTGIFKGALTGGTGLKLGESTPPTESSSTTTNGHIPPPRPNK